MSDSPRDLLENGRTLFRDGDSGVSDFYRTHLHVADRPRERLRLALLGVPALQRLRALSLDAHARRFGDDRIPEVWDEPLQMLSAARRSESMDVRGALNADGTPHRAILQRDYTGTPRSRVIAFLFDPAGRAPFAVLKVRRTNADASPLAAEQDALNTLHASLPPQMAERVPSPLAFGSGNGAEALLMSFLPGESPYLHMRNRLWPARGVPDHFCAAADWLGRFHLATGAPARGDDWDRTCALHGDFWARNLLSVGCESTGVIDWEHFSAAGPPCLDLFHFPVTYGAAYPWRLYRRVALPDAFRRTFLRRNRVSRAVRTYLSRYCEITGGNPAALPGLCEKYLQHRAESAPAESSDWLACITMLRAGPHPAFPSHAATRPH